MKKLLLIPLTLFFFSCDNLSCLGGETDECGVCDGPGKVEECEWVEQCEWESVYVPLGSDSYCTNGCAQFNGEYCSSYHDCMNYDFIGGCNNGVSCVTYEYQEQYICDNELFCQEVCP